MILLQKIDITVGKSIFQITTITHHSDSGLTSLVKIAILARAITYDNDCEALRQARRDFKVSLQQSTVRKWRKRLLETRSIQKGKLPRRHCSSTDAATMGRILEAFDANSQKNLPAKLYMSLVLCYRLIAVIWRIAFQQYRASQILCAHTDCCRSRPWLACQLANGASYSRCFQDTHSVISVYFPSRWSRASMYICKVETLAFTDCDYCYTLVL